VEDVRDAELITAARAGDETAYEELYRRHRAAALRFARSLTGAGGDAEDLVADAFARVLAALRGGNGPDQAFRPYLLSSVRNAFYDHARRAAREQPVDELTPLAPGVPFVDPVLAKDESRLVAIAFGDLPERWQLVLWHTEVEGEKPAQVASLLGISANAVSALAYRAREGLRERYLQAHLASATDEQCQPTVDRLAGYIRNKLSRAEAQRVRKHLDGCDRCRLLFVELTDINSRLGAILGPIVLGGAAAGYLAAGGGAAATAGTVGTFGTAGTLLGWILRRPEAQVGGGVTVLAGTAALIFAFAANPVVPAEVVSIPTPTAPTVLPPSTTPPPPTSTPTPSPSEPTPSTTGPAPRDTVSTSTAPSPSVLLAPEPTPQTGVELSVALEPMVALVRGRPGLLRLTVRTPTSADDEATLALTATVTLPEGVTLRIGNAGNGWNCVNGDDGAVICNRSSLPAGRTTWAHIHLSIGDDAADGVPWVELSGPGVVPVTALATAGVVSHRSLWPDDWSFWPDDWSLWPDEREEDRLAYA
jgi:RNA polymerase sigma factor (sigma-70 family)